MSNVRSLFQIACNLQAVKKYNEALSIYNQILDLMPNHLSSLYNMAIIKNAMGNFNDALKDIEAAIENCPHYEKSYFVRAQIRENKSLLDLAIEDYIKFAIMDKESKMYYDTLINIGNILYAQGKYDEACSYYSDAINDNYLKPCAHYNLGLVYRSQEKFIEAINKCNIAINLDPYYVSAYTQRGYCYAMIEEYVKAYKSYLHGVKLRYPNYNCEEMVKIFFGKEIDKSVDTYKQIYNAGFFPIVAGDLKKCIIISPSISDSELILDPREIYINSTYRRYLKKHRKSYELIYDFDFSIIIENIYKHWGSKNYTALLYDHYNNLINKNDSTPHAVAVALLYNGEIVAGEIGIELSKHIYYSESAFSTIPYAGKVLCFLLAEHLADKGFQIWNFGGSTIRWNNYKRELGAKMINSQEYLNLNKNFNPGADKIFLKKKKKFIKIRS